MLVANGVTVRIDSRDDFTPTPVVSQAILTHNRAADGTQRFTGEGLADGIVVTPSHNPPTDGGFKYDPVTGGPAPAETTNAIAARANELLGDFKSIKRVPYEEAIKSEYVEGFDFREHYVDPGWARSRHGNRRVRARRWRRAPRWRSSWPGRTARGCRSRGTAGR